MTTLVYNMHRSETEMRNVIGVWVNVNNDMVSLAYDMPFYCINRHFINDAGALVLSRQSIGGNVDHGVCESPEWRLVEINDMEVIRALLPKA